MCEHLASVGFNIYNYKITKKIYNYKRELMTKEGYDNI